MNNHIIVILVSFVLAFLSVIFGYYLRGVVDQNILKVPTMAYGYYEQNNVWNRIRVDENGKVMCSK